MPRLKKHKKLSAIGKGNLNEKRTKEFFEKLGFIVHDAHRQKFRNNDFFGLFDHVMTYKDSGKGSFTFTTSNGSKVDSPITTSTFSCYESESIWIQTKTNRMPDKAYVGKLKQFVIAHKLLVIWYDNKEEPFIYYISVYGGFMWKVKQIKGQHGNWTATEPTSTASTVSTVAVRNRRKD